MTLGGLLAVIFILSGAANWMSEMHMELKHLGQKVTENTSEQKKMTSTLMNHFEGMVELRSKVQINENSIKEIKDNLRERR